MAGFYGSDTDHLRQHGAASRQGAQALIELTDRVTAVIDAASWVGSDAEAFRTQWHGTVKARLRTQADTLRGTGDQLDQHAEEQDQASTADGGGGGLLDLIGDPHVQPPLLGGPLNGLPLTADVLRDLADGLDNWFTGGDAEGDQHLYGSGEDFGEGQVAADGRPIGPSDAGGSHWEGREIDNERGYSDGYAETRASAGAHATQDEYGNHTASAGARAGAEIGFDEMLYGPDGTPLISADGRAGAEAYAEGGASIGLDGASAGARAGAGVYGDISNTFHGPMGSSYEIGVEGYAGAHAEANAYANLTRNEDGQMNGVEWGAGAEAFAGAEGAVEFERTSPGGWFSSEGSVGAQGGFGAGSSSGGSISTDEISFGLGGEFAVYGGGTGDLSAAIHPNAIVDSFTPGDYNLDDAFGDASGAAHDAGHWVADTWPF
ncbi:WXG100 family type VII secretion target [Brachybacterium vulturis]|uniref:WXG100 family type VII secretion target n=1 Tax=Brachybacterium vulturis TaxID=2017484 RepID=UPI0037355D7D